MLELSDLNLLYHNVRKLDEYGLVSLIPTEENKEILALAKEQYRRNTIDDEFVGNLGENCAYLESKFSTDEKTTNKSEHIGKVYILERVS